MMNICPANGEPCLLACGRPNSVFKLPCAPSPGIGHNGGPPLEDERPIAGPSRVGAWASSVSDEAKSPEEEEAKELPGTVISDGVYHYYMPLESGVAPPVNLNANTVLFRFGHLWMTPVGGPSWDATDLYRWPVWEAVDEDGYPTDLGAEDRLVDPRAVSLPDDQDLRNEMPIYDGCVAYFPNALAAISQLSYKATQQHHPDEEMHWDRSKSTDHLNKIIRHSIDAGKFDDKGVRHSAGLAWRALANLQEELERELGLPPSPASRNRSW